MEPMLLLILGILSITAQRHNYGIDAARNPHLKDIRVRRQVDFEPYAFEDKHQAGNGDADSVPEETISVKSIFKGAQIPKHVFNGKRQNSEKHSAPAPPTDEYGYNNEYKPNNNEYNTHNNEYKANNNEYKHNNNGYNTNNNENGFVYNGTAINILKIKKRAIKTNPAHFMNGFGCSSFGKLIKIGDTTMCSKKKANSSEEFLDI